jgi:hypothetical protein
MLLDISINVRQVAYFPKFTSSPHPLIFSMPSPFTILTLSPSLLAPDHLHTHPKERKIDRATLLDVAPDRESLILSNKSIEELRQVLKIQVGPEASTG